MKDIIRNKENLAYFNSNIFKKLTKLAENSDLFRSRICIHTNNNAKTNEMIIALKRGSYIRPHTHPNFKSESYHIIKGSMTVFVFNKKGNLQKKIKMGEVRTGLNFYYRMSKSYYHMPVATSKYCIYHETYSGPFYKEKDVIFPKWSPNNHDKEKYLKFLKKNKLTKYFNDK
tara:strand:- start:35 stop:550 length:516 start_codon:yes stop_codon:yes gene_type:complete